MEIAAVAARQAGESDRVSEKQATTYLEAIREGLWEEMEADESVFIIGEDLGRYGGAFKLTDGFLAHFGPDRVIDTPISEAAVVGAALGAAYMGFRPVVEMQFIDFIASAFGMLVNFGAKLRYRTGESAPIVIRGPCGAGGRAGRARRSCRRQRDPLPTPGWGGIARVCRTLQPDLPHRGPLGLAVH